MRKIKIKLGIIKLKFNIISLGVKGPHAKQAWLEVDNLERIFT